MSKEEKYHSVIIPTEKIAPNMIFAGFLEVPHNFKNLSEKHIAFLKKYGFQEIKINRNGKEIIVDSDSLVYGDKLLELGRLKKYTLLTDSDKIKNYLIRYGFSVIKALIPIQDEVPPEAEIVEDLNQKILVEAEKKEEEEESQLREEIQKQPAIVKDQKTAKKQTDREKLESLQESIEASEKLQKKGGEILEELFQSGNFQNFKLEAISEVAKGMSETMNTNSASYNALTILKDHDEYTYRHCVDVANQMLMVLKYMYQSRVTNLKEIAIGGLLHDIGKSKIPLDIINKPGKLSDDEWKYMRMHPVYSAKIMQEMKLSNLQISIGLKHHVRKNGTGYPANVPYGNTSEIDRICSISDVFQALITKRPYKLTDTPVEAFKKIKKWTHTDFDDRLVDIFIKAFGIFPPGSMVRLSDNRYAFVIVRGVNTVRPTVAVVADEMGNFVTNNEIIDLENDDYRSLSIASSVDHRKFYSDEDALKKFLSLT